MRKLSLIPVLLLPVVANAQIYRCAEGEVTVYSDQPCNEQSMPFELAGNLSVIAGADDYADTLRRNREYVDARQSDIAQRRLAARHRAEARAEREQQNQTAPQPVRVMPTYPAPYIGYGNPYKRHYRDHQHRPRKPGHGGPDHDARPPVKPEPKAVKHRFSFRGVDH